MKDCNGTELHIGDSVSFIYSQSLMCTGIVTEFTSRKIRIRYGTGVPQSQSLKFPEQVCKVADGVFVSISKEAEINETLKKTLNEDGIYFITLNEKSPVVESFCVKVENSMVVKKRRITEHMLFIEMKGKRGPQREVRIQKVEKD